MYERVEDDVDRGRGRIEDERTYEIRRLQDDRDERLRRIQPRRESERFEEEYDRRRRIDARADAARTERREAGSPSQRERAIGETSPTTIVRPTDDSIPDPGGSALARFVAEQEQLLSAARERYQADLRAAEAERDEAARAGGTQRAARSPSAASPSAVRSSPANTSSTAAGSSGATDRLPRAIGTSLRQ